MRANCENSSTSFHGFDLGDDRGGTLVDQCPRGFRRTGKVPLQALRRQLNRRQRVLDLVRQPPRDFAPCGHLLCPDERRHVVKNDDDAVCPPFRPSQRRHHDEQMQFPPVA
jgi:hypothetical protein